MLTSGGMYVCLLPAMYSSNLETFSFVCDALLSYALTAPTLTCLLVLLFLTTGSTDSGGNPSRTTMSSSCQPKVGDRLQEDDVRAKSDVDVH